MTAFILVSVLCQLIVLQAIFIYDSEPIFVGAAFPISSWKFLFKSSRLILNDLDLIVLLYNGLTGSLICIL